MEECAGKLTVAPGLLEEVDLRFLLSALVRPRAPFAAAWALAAVGVASVALAPRQPVGTPPQGATFGGGSTWMPLAALR